MNFVIELSKVKEKNVVCVIVNRLTKKRHIIVINHKIKTREFARFFINHVYRLHKLSRSIINDRKTRFVNEF